MIIESRRKGSTFLGLRGTEWSIDGVPINPRIDMPIILYLESKSTQTLRYRDKRTGRFCQPLNREVKVEATYLSISS